MPRFEREHVADLVDRLASPDSRHIIAITGPRQAGKTTIVEQALSRMTEAEHPSVHVRVDDPGTDAIGQIEATAPDYRTLSRPASAAMPVPDPGAPRDTGWLVRVWQSARERAGRSSNGFILALDEIQHVPRWSATVKGLWDADRSAGCPLKVIVLGSAPLPLLIGRNESLAGRFELFPVAQWSFAEMARAFGRSLDEYLFFGGYPGAPWLDPRSLGYSEDRWREYILDSIVEPTIGRDLMGLVRIEKPRLMRNLADLGAEYSGQVLSYNKMIGQLQDRGNTTTVANYLDMLGEIGLIKGLSKYSAKPHLRQGSSPKLIALDPSVMTANSGYTFGEAKADRTFWGRLVESAVGSHLHNTLPSGGRLRYWRRNGLEVDFVLHQRPHVVAIEVKSGHRPASVGQGLDAFRSRFPGSRGLVVGGEGIPLNEFLAEPASKWLREGQ